MSFYLFRRYLFSSRSGSLIRVVSRACMLGMAISIAALLLIVSIMGGFGKAIKERMLKDQAHIIIELKKKPFPLKKRKKQSLLIDKNKGLSSLSFLTPDLKKEVKEVLIFEEEEILLKTKSGL